MGARVVAANGDKPISEVEEGDTVFACDEDVDGTASDRVTNIISHRDQVVGYVTIGGERLTMTLEHLLLRQ